MTLLQLTIPATHNLSHSHSRSQSHRLATAPATSSMCPVSIPKAATKTPGADCEAVHPSCLAGCKIRPSSVQNPSCKAWCELSVASFPADLLDTVPCKPLPTSSCVYAEALSLPAPVSVCRRSTRWTQRPCSRSFCTASSTLRPL